VRRVLRFCDPDQYRFDLHPLYHQSRALLHPSGIAWHEGLRANRREARKNRKSLREQWPSRHQASNPRSAGQYRSKPRQRTKLKQRGEPTEPSWTSGQLPLQKFSTLPSRLPFTTQAFTTAPNDVPVTCAAPTTGPSLLIPALSSKPVPKGTDPLPINDNDQPFSLTRPGDSCPDMLMLESMIGPTIRQVSITYISPPFVSTARPTPEEPPMPKPPCGETMTEP
jgi:hypothetical protein